MSDTDVVVRLRQTRADMLGTNDEQHYWDCHDAATEIEQLREAIRRLADQDATLSVQGGSVTVTMDATLSNVEREAIEWAIADQIEGGHQDHLVVKEIIATLRNLLEKTK